MDTKSITAVIIGLMVSGVILVAFVPIFTEVTATEDTFTNVGYYDMDALSSDDSYKLFWNHEQPYQVTLNDVDVIEFNGLSDYQAVTLIGSENFTFRFFNVSDNPRVQLYGGTGYGFGGASVSAGTDMTAIVNEGNITFTNTAETPLEVTNTLPDSTFAIVKNGNWVMKQSTTPAKVLDESSIIVLCGLTEGNNLQAGVYAEGTVNDGLDYTLFRPANQSETAVFSNEQITATEISGYVGLVSLEKVDFTVTLEGGDLNPTYSYFIVPKNVTAEKSVHGDDVFNTVINIIPLIAGVGLLMAGVYYFISRK